MVVAAVGRGKFSRLVAVNPVVAVADDNAAVGKTPVRHTAYRIAEFMLLF